MKRFILLNVIILTFESKIFLAENLNFCDGSQVRSLKELSKLKECDVIEGNLIIAFGDATSSKDWEKYGSLQVREVTGFVVFFFLDQLKSLDLVLPNLRVIRGNTLYENYALIIYGIMDLKTISLNNLTTILQGSVFIRNNPWLNSYTHRILWNNITHWNNGPDITHMNIIQQVQGPIEMCNDSCRPEGSLVGYCWARDVCQKVCPQRYSPLSCTASGEPCPEECIGGCYKNQSVTKCYACKHYRNSDGCTESCYPGYILDNYRCVGGGECIALGRKLLELKNTKFECVKECPESYKQDSLNSSLCILCSDCKKTCKGLIVDSVERAQELSGCEIINGSLEIRVYGKRIMQALSKHLGRIQEVDGYVYVHHSRELKSLKFLGNLTKINGEEMWQKNYSFVVHDNDDLEELWNATSTGLKLNNGHPLFYANPKLCPHSINTLIGEKVWKEAVPDDDLRRVLNGNKRACSIKKGLDFNIMPLYEKGVLHITVTSGLVPKQNLLGFYVYYKETKKATLEYYGADWHWKRVFQPMPSWEVKLKLKPATRYAIFFESKTTDPLYNFQSVIKYAITKPFNPSPPENVRVSSSSLDNAEILWDPPQFPNGIIDHYVISFQPIRFKISDDEDMCDKNVMKKYMEYYNKEKETQKQIAQKEEKERFESRAIKSESHTEVSDMSCSEDINIDETLDRKREHINMAKKLSDLIYASSSNPHKARRKRRHTNFELIDQICKGIDGQVKRSVPKGLRRNLDTVSKGPDIQPLVIDNTLMENLQNPSVISQLHDELNELTHSTHPTLSYDCTVFLFNLTQQRIENPKNKIELNYRDFHTDVDQPRFLSSFNFTDEDKIIHETNYNITNLTSSLYEFRIMACQKRLLSTEECGDRRTKSPCKLCSYWYKTRINIHLDKELYQTEIKVREVNKNNNNVSVTWMPPKYLPVNEILYYTLYVQEIGNSSLARKNSYVFCEGPSSNQTSFVIPKIGKYNVTVAAFSVFNGETPRSNPASFVISKTVLLPSQDTSNTTQGGGHKNSNTKGVFVILISVTIFILISLVVYYFFNHYKYSKENREKKEKILNYLDAKVSSNPSYVYPKAEEYAEEKIGKRYLYSKTDLIIDGSMLGEGHFGVVQKGTLIRSKEELINVAVKMLRTDSGGTSSSYIDLINEASLMLKIKCFHLVEMYGVALIEGNIFLVMEYMDNKNLRNYIKENVTDGDIFQLFTKEKLLEIAVQIADGMAYLAHKNILHRDLATRNILLDSFINAKVSDFGMSRVVEGEYYRVGRDKLVPIRWMPPEYFTVNKFTTKSDVWSYGVLIWEIMNPGKIPYGNKTKNEDVKLEVINNVLPGEIPSKAPFDEIMSACWNICPKKRPTFCSIVGDLHTKLIDEDFKNTFEKMSFYFSEECPQNDDFTDTIEIDEPDDTPSTPLTSTPSLAHSHFLRENLHHMSENMELFRERTSPRIVHKSLSSLQASLSKSLTFVNNFRESFGSSSHKISEISNAFPHKLNGTPESQKHFSNGQLKSNPVYKNVHGVVQV